MKSRAERAKQNFYDGYNCTQSVVLAFNDLLDVDSDTLLKLASPFGGGMGRMREVCGAVSGMYIVLGLLEGYSDDGANGKKAELYSKVRDLADKFRNSNGSIICRELLTGVDHTEGGIPEARTLEYYQKRPCPDIIYNAAKILDEYISN